MNPSSNETPGMQLPAPVSEQLPVPAVPTENLQSLTERVAASPEMSPATGISMPAVSPVIPLPDPQSVAVNVPQTDVSSTTQSSGLAVADDSDLIEKEWVTKAKMIVEQNRDDPYKQTEELTVVKADYMQKRYNKTIKLSK